MLPSGAEEEEEEEQRGQEVAAAARRAVQLVVVVRSASAAVVSAEGAGGDVAPQRRSVRPHRPAPCRGRQSPESAALTALQFSLQVFTISIN